MAAPLNAADLYPRSPRSLEGMSASQRATELARKRRGWAALVGARSPLARKEAEWYASAEARDKVLPLLLKRVDAGRAGQAGGGCGNSSLRHTMDDDTDCDPKIDYLRSWLQNLSKASAAMPYQTIINRIDGQCAIYNGIINDIRRNTTDSTKQILDIVKARAVLIIITVHACDYGRALLSHLFDNPDTILAPPLELQSLARLQENMIDAHQKYFVNTPTYNRYLAYMFVANGWVYSRRHPDKDVTNVGEQELVFALRLVPAHVMTCDDDADLSGGKQQPQRTIATDLAPRSPDGMNASQRTKELERKRRGWAALVGARSPLARSKVVEWYASAEARDKLIVLLLSRIKRNENEHNIKDRRLTGSGNCMGGFPLLRHAKALNALDGRLNASPTDTATVAIEINTEIDRINATLITLRSKDKPTVETLSDIATISAFITIFDSKGVCNEDAVATYFENVKHLLRNWNANAEADIRSSMDAAIEMVNESLAALRRVGNDLHEEDEEEKKADAMVDKAIAEVLRQKLSVVPQRKIGGKK